MKMHKEKYEELLRRFSQELHEAGVTEDLLALVKAKFERAPNILASNDEETTNRFVYRHAGYMIEAQTTVKLVVKKCK